MTQPNADEPAYTIEQLLSEFGQDILPAYTLPSPNQPQNDIPRAEPSESEAQSPLDWPNPGDLELPPDATADLIIAYIDVLLLQTEYALSQAANCEDQQEPAGMIANLSIASQNAERLNSTLRQLASHDGQPQPAPRTQRLLTRYHDAYTEIRALVTSFHDAHLQFAVDVALHEQTLLPHLTSCNARISANLAAIEYCRDQVERLANDTEVHAYRYWLFDLHHNSHYMAAYFESAHEQAAHELPDICLDDAGIERSCDIADAERDRFNRTIPTVLSERIAKAQRDAQHDLPDADVETLDFSVGITRNLHEIRDRFPAKDCGDDFVCVAYYHEGTKYLQAASEPYPKGFPAGRAYQHMEEVFRQFHQNDIPDEADLVTSAYVVQTLATHGVHDLSAADVRGIIDQARRHSMTDGAIADLLAAIVDHDVDAAEHLLRMGGLNVPQVTRNTARKVITAARELGLDDHQLAEVAAAMGWSDAHKIGVKIRPQPRRAVTAIVKTAQRAGLPQDAITNIRQALTESATADTRFYTTP